MVKGRLYRIEYAIETNAHIDAIEHKYYSIMSTTISQQLTHTPTEQTRNRKLLRRPAPYNAIWELRFGTNNRFRVRYEVNEIEFIVTVLAIGIKDGNNLIFGGEIYES